MITFIPVDPVDEVLDAALDRTPVPRSRRSRSRPHTTRAPIATAKSR
jgi:hypothetical protein